MFKDQDFDIFTIAGLEERMALIRQEIQPTFQKVDEELATVLAEALEEPLYIHIAQHRRRTVYPPESTWSAISPHKRGYKMAPHFQVGIWPDFVFLYLSYIDNPKGEQEMADRLLAQPELFATLPKDTVIALDHTKPAYQRLEEADLPKALTRLRDVKKGEFQIGRVIPRHDVLWQDEHLTTYMQETFLSLVPIYQASLGEDK